MKLSAGALVLMVLTLLPDPGLLAQQKQIPSPRDSVFLKLDTNVVSVNYGRPSIRGRVIMGGLVPWDKVWRTGANEATHLQTNFDMMFGSIPLTRGKYTLWTIPRPASWTIIINKQTGQWGTHYDERQDLARFEVKSGPTESLVDTFSVALERGGPTSGVLKLMWERTLVSIPLEKSNKVRPLSPGDSTEWVTGGKKVSIRYSKPYARGRDIWGVVVPMDSVWRTGANLATTFVTEADLMVGTTAIPKGAYTLYSLPKEKSFTLIISKKEAGPANYDGKLDLARVEMKLAKPSKMIDPFRMWLEPEGTSTALLHLGWTDREYSVRLTAK